MDERRWKTGENFPCKNKRITNQKGMKRKVLLALFYLSIGSLTFLFGMHNQKRAYSNGYKDAFNFVISELENYCDSLKNKR